MHVVGVGGGEGDDLDWGRERRGANSTLCCWVMPTMRETRVPSLGWEDLLEKKMAIHSSILVWKMSWTEEPGRLQSMGSQRVVRS